MDYIRKSFTDYFIKNNKLNMTCYPFKENDISFFIKKFYEFCENGSLNIVDPMFLYLLKTLCSDCKDSDLIKWTFEFYHKREILLESQLYAKTNCFSILLKYNKDHELIKWVFEFCIENNMYLNICYLNTLIEYNKNSELIKWAFLLYLRKDIRIYRSCNTENNPIFTLCEYCKYFDLIKWVFDFYIENEFPINERKTSNKFTPLHILCNKNKDPVKNYHLVVNVY